MFSDSKWSKFYYRIYPFILGSYLIAMGSVISALHWLDYVPTQNKVLGGVIFPAACVLLGLACILRGVEYVKAYKKYKELLKRMDEDFDGVDDSDEE